MFQIRRLLPLVCYTVVLLLVGCKEAKPVRTIEPLNNDWGFVLGDDETYSSEAYDDSAWRRLDLPHDWSSEHTAQVDSLAQQGCDSLCGEIGWYRKYFTTPKHMNKVINLEFSGVYMNSTVYVNGIRVGHSPYGNTSFSYDVTHFLHKTGMRNLIAVRCDNSLQNDAYCYDGCGICGGVRMVVTNNIYVETSLTRITTSDVSDHSAMVHAVVAITNKGPKRQSVMLVNTIHDADGKRERKSEIKKSVKAGESIEVEMAMQIPNPIVSNDNTDYMYELRSAIEIENSEVDVSTTKFTIRRDAEYVEDGVETIE